MEIYWPEIGHLEQLTLLSSFCSELECCVKTQYILLFTLLSFLLDCTPRLRKSLMYRVQM
jgi:hypothetical protein